MLFNSWGNREEEISHEHGSIKVVGIYAVNIVQVEKKRPNGAFELMTLFDLENTAEEEVKNPEPVNSMPNSNGPAAQSTNVQIDTTNIRNAPKSK